MRNERNQYTDVLFARACSMHTSIPRLLRQLMARNVYPWKYLCYRHCVKSFLLSLQDIQQAGNVHAVKDIVPNRKGTFENPTKGQPK